MYENGSIQHSNFRTYELVLKTAKKLFCDLHAHYPFPILLLGVGCTKMVVLNTLTSRHMN